MRSLWYSIFQLVSGYVTSNNHDGLLLRLPNVLAQGKKNFSLRPDDGSQNFGPTLGLETRHPQKSLKTPQEFHGTGAANFSSSFPNFEGENNGIRRLILPFFWPTWLR